MDPIHSSGSNSPSVARQENQLVESMISVQVSFIQGPQIPKTDIITPPSPRITSLKPDLQE